MLRSEAGAPATGCCASFAALRSQKTGFCICAQRHYYVQVIANPGHVLRETTTANDTTLRQVIISGTRGHRHVKVPAWNGIAPEP